MLKDSRCMFLSVSTKSLLETFEVFTGRYSNNRGLRTHLNIRPGILNVVPEVQAEQRRI